MDRIECIICGEFEEDCTCDEIPYPQPTNEDKEEDLR
jgi:hypothetical protein